MLELGEGFRNKSEISLLFGLTVGKLPGLYGGQKSVFASAKQGEPLVDYVPSVALHLLSPDQGKQHPGAMLEKYARATVKEKISTLYNSVSVLSLEFQMEYMGRWIQS